MVDELPHYLEAPPIGILAEKPELRLRILSAVIGRNTGVDRNSLGLVHGGVCIEKGLLSNRPVDAPLPSLFSRRYREWISTPFPIGCRVFCQNNILSTRRMVTIHLRVPEQLKDWIDYQQQSVALHTADATS